MRFITCHKCRLCGDVFETGTAKDTDAAEEMIISIYNDVTLHYCDNGDIGLADLQGCKVVEE